MDDFLLHAVLPFLHSTGLTSFVRLPPIWNKPILPDRPSRQKSWGVPGVHPFHTPNSVLALLQTQREIERIEAVSAAGFVDSRQRKARTGDPRGRTADHCGDALECEKCPL